MDPIEVRERQHAFGLERCDDLVHLRRAAAVRCQRLLRRPVLYELDRPEAAHPPHIPDRGVTPSDLPQTRADDVLAEAVGVGDHPLVLHGGDRRNRCRTGERMSRIGQSARVGPVAERLEDRVRDGNPTERNVPGVHTFGEGDEVRGDVPVVEGEPATGATEAGHHLVGDEDDPVLRRQLAHAGEVAGRRGVDPCGARHGLEDECGDIAGPFEGDHVFEVGQRPLRLLGLGRRVEVRPIRVGGHEVNDALSGVVVGEPARITGDVDGQLRAAVVAAVGREHLRPACVQTGHPDRVLVGVGSPVREEHVVEVARGAFGDESGRFGAGVVDVLRRDGAQLAGLLLDRRDHTRVLMADIGVHQLR